MVPIGQGARREQSREHRRHRHQQPGWGAHRRLPALPGVKLKTLCDIDENNFGHRHHRAAAADERVHAVERAVRDALQRELVHSPPVKKMSRTCPSILGTLGIHGNSECARCGTSTTAVKTSRPRPLETTADARASAASRSERQSTKTQAPRAKVPLVSTAFHPTRSGEAHEDERESRPARGFGDAARGCEKPRQLEVPSFEAALPHERRDAVFFVEPRLITGRAERDETGGDPRERDERLGQDRLDSARHEDERERVGPRDAPAVEPRDASTEGVGQAPFGERNQIGEAPFSGRHR